MEAAIKLRSLIYILVLLKTLMDYKLGRPRLIMKPTAFESSRGLISRVMLPFLVRDFGVLIFESEMYKNRRNPSRYRIRNN